MKNPRWTLARPDESEHLSSNIFKLNLPWPWECVPPCSSPRYSGPVSYRTFADIQFIWYLIPDAMTSGRLDILLSAHLATGKTHYRDTQCGLEPEFSHKFYACHDRNLISGHLDICMSKFWYKICCPVPAVAILLAGGFGFIRNTFLLCWTLSKWFSPNNIRNKMWTLTRSWDYWFFVS